jgi:serine/threonine-protein kinase
LACSLTAPPVAAAEPAELAAKARAILEANCFRCHGKDGTGEGGFDYILNVAKLIERKKVVPRDPEKSKLFRRVSSTSDPMPPEDEKPRPSKDDIGALQAWIAAGAPEFPNPALAQRPFLTDKDVYRAMYDHLFAQHKESARYTRYLTLTHLHNNPRVGEAELRLYRAGVAKLLNSLSWRRALVPLQAIDKHGAVLAFDLRDLDWDLNNAWLLLIGHTADEPKDAFHPGYPYALTHERYPEDDQLNRLAEQVYKLSGTRVPAVRADWFLATASLPPLYHDLLSLPVNARDLEAALRVNVAVNFRRDRAARAGFARSGVSANANRLVERHEGAYGAYWKSYDFRSSEGTGNLFRFPLGPASLARNPFPDQAFEHAGGEIIFNLPNGLQGYLLVNAKDERINEGPSDIVRDKNETAGRSTTIVNGLSCMACHKHGMIRELKDGVRAGAGLQGDALDKVKRLYLEQKEMDRLLLADEELFLASLDKVMGPFVRQGPDAKKDIRLFPEPISLLATPFLRGNVTLEDAALELGIADPQEFKASIKANGRLRDELGLKPWLNGDTIKRDVWQSVKGLTSTFQETAAELQRGTPYRTRR